MTYDNDFSFGLRKTQQQKLADAAGDKDRDLEVRAQMLANLLSLGPLNAIGNGNPSGKELADLWRKTFGLDPQPFLNGWDGPALQGF